MAIVDITIIPIGTKTPSISKYVAEIQKVLKKYQASGEIRYQLTPMNTIIEGELSKLFEVILAMHEVPFSKGAIRVATNIRIDDRRDLPNRKMEDKVQRVLSQMGE
ncbi:MTH1187 family thiamine-binding protein [Bacillaceae bacterium Marseille-Q3522]|nr:MTH1187 family thiamine-binding protein [Bacillaceae bacterium Marseille-Q3522]